METERWRAQRALTAIEGEAVAAGLLAPVADTDAERSLWRACDLASVVEGCFHQRLEPAALDAETEARWLARIAGCFALPPVDLAEPDEDAIEVERYLWLLDGQRRAGTIKLGASPFRGPWLGVSSLYTLAAHRGRGIAGAALDHLAQAALREGLRGVRLATCWTWQRALSFYLQRGFWVRGWKHDVQLALEPRLPEPRFVIDGEVAALEVASHAGPARRLLTARREGELLRLDEAAGAGGEERELGHLATGTFAMHLALAGWPLVRSAHHWARRWHWSDAGEPEGLALKIGVFEQLARERGWVVDTARIPGLDRWLALTTG